MYLTVLLLQFLLDLDAECDLEAIHHSIVVQHIIISNMAVTASSEFSAVLTFA